MKRLLLIFVFLAVSMQPVYAADISAPSVPSSVEDLMPYETESFAEALQHVILTALKHLQPDISECCHVCLSLIAVAIVLSLIRGLQEDHSLAIRLAGSILIACLLLKSTNSLVRDAAETVTELSEYGKLLLPVMTTAMATQGGANTSAAIYIATAFVDSVLTSAISKLMIPMVYIYLILCILHSAIAEDTLKRLRDTVKWLIGWSLKTVLYVFTGYLTITGVVSGTADQIAVKATKLTISGMVPVVGGIIADASETILVSAGLVKNAAGTYGLLALVAIAVGPFINIGVQYLLLKASASLCGIFADKVITDLIADFCAAMGFLLAMTGTVCLVLMISTICFMKGMG